MIWETIKDFGIAFLVVWLVWPLISTILFMPFEMARRLFRYRISTSMKRLWVLCSLLLVISLSVFVRFGQEWLYEQYTQPLNPPLKIETGESAYEYRQSDLQAFFLEADPLFCYEDECVDFEYYPEEHGGIVGTAMNWLLIIDEHGNGVLRHGLPHWNGEIVIDNQFVSFNVLHSARK